MKEFSKYENNRFKAIYYLLYTILISVITTVNWITRQDKFYITVGIAGIIISSVFSLVKFLYSFPKKKQESKK